MTAPTVDEDLKPPSACTMAAPNETVKSKSFDEPKPTSKVSDALCAGRFFLYHIQDNFSSVCPPRTLQYHLRPRGVDIKLLGPLLGP